MRKLYLSGAIALVLASAAVVAWAATTVSFTPPPETGQIFTIINYQRDFGKAQPTYATVDFGSSHRRIIVSPPYRRCASSFPAGFVLRTRHSQPGSPLLTISTTGTVVRGPYQGDPPLELLHPCYRLVK